MGGNIIRVNGHQRCSVLQSAMLYLLCWWIVLKGSIEYCVVITDESAYSEQELVEKLTYSEQRLHMFFLFNCWPYITCFICESKNYSSKTRVANFYNYRIDIFFLMWRRPTCRTAYNCNYQGKYRNMVLDDRRLKLRGLSVN